MYGETKLNENSTEIINIFTLFESHFSSISTNHSHKSRLETARIETNDQSLSYGIDLSAITFIKLT